MNKANNKSAKNMEEFKGVNVCNSDMMLGIDQSNFHFQTYMKYIKLKLSSNNKQCELFKLLIAK